MGIRLRQSPLRWQDWVTRRHRTLCTQRPELGPGVTQDAALATPAAAGEDPNGRGAASRIPVRPPANPAMWVRLPPARRADAGGRREEGRAWVSALGHQKTSSVNAAKPP